jgi:hypothetical protein
MTKKRAKKSLKSDVLSVDNSVVQNSVAKFAHHFNNAVFFRDRTSYSRKNKHKGTEPFSLYLHAAVTVYRERFTLFIDDFKFQTKYPAFPLVSSRHR